MTPSSRGRINRRKRRQEQREKSASDDERAVITKFVQEDFLTATLLGELKFGTLTEYRRVETSAEHRLSDGQEGIHRRFTRDTTFKNFRAPGLELTNVSIVGFSEAISLSQRFEGYIFCATDGDYDPSVHREIHKRNPSLTAYVVFDLKKFMRAASAVATHLFPNQNAGALSKMVRYLQGEREEELSWRHLQLTPPLAELFDRAVFSKPDRFAHEKENPIALIPALRSVSEPIFVRNLPRRFAHLFKLAALHHGRLPPDEPHN